MTKKNFNKAVGYILLPLITFFVASAICLRVTAGFVKEADRRESVVSSTFEIYSINPATLLGPLETNAPNAFTQLGSGEDFYWENQYLPEAYSPVQWTQADYVMVTDRFLQQVLNEPLKNWKTHSLGFVTDCNDADAGPQSLTMDLFRSTDTREEESRIELNVSVYPKSGQVNRFETEYYPSVNGVASLELDKIKIPAEEALQIVEMNGGQNTRQSVNNKCEVVVSLTAGIMDNSWSVRYQSDGKTLLGAFVDEQTGKQK